MSMATLRENQILCEGSSHYVRRHNETMTRFNIMQPEHLLCNFFETIANFQAFFSILARKTLMFWYIKPNHLLKNQHNQPVISAKPVVYIQIKSKLQNVYKLHIRSPISLHNHNAPSMHTIKNLANINVRTIDQTNQPTNYTGPGIVTQI